MLELQIYGTMKLFDTTKKKKKKKKKKKTEKMCKVLEYLK